MFGCLPWWVKLDWRVKRRVWLGLCAFELPITVVLLTLFGISSPNTYRTKLWQEGYVNGWSSNPKQVLYAAANYQPILPDPKPWSQLVTDWGVVVSVLSTFILIVKIVMFLTHTFPPMFSSGIHLGLLIVWCYSASLQGASDYSDPKRPSPVPWFITHSCGDPVSEENRGYCQQAKATFGVTIVEILIYAVFFVFSVVMSFPSQEQKAKQAEIEQEKREWEEIENFDDKQFNYELDQMHVPMQTPMSFNFPAGVGVLQQPESYAHYPQDTKEGFGVSVHEGGTSAEQARTPNKDLPLRHHITSDVYA